jgi:hypothetical protein
MEDQLLGEVGTHIEEKQIWSVKAFGLRFSKIAATSILFCLSTSFW